MSDTTRLPQGIVINGSLLVARPVNTIVESGNTLYRSIDAATPAYVALTGPPSGPWTLEFVGQGQGATKTTTVLDGPTIAEAFAVGDRVYTHWGVPDGFDRTRDVTIRAHFYLSTSEVGKVVSWQMAVGESDGNQVNVIRQTINAADVPVAAQYYDAHADFLVDAATVNLAAADSLHVRLERIASSDDPTADPRVHLIQLRQA